MLACLPSSSHSCQDCTEPGSYAPHTLSPSPRRQVIKVWDTCRQQQVVSWVRRIEGALHTYTSEYLGR